MRIIGELTTNQPEIWGISIMKVQIRKYKIKLMTGKGHLGIGTVRKIIASQLTMKRITSERN